MKLSKGLIGIMSWAKRIPLKLLIMTLRSPYYPIAAVILREKALARFWIGCMSLVESIIQKITKTRIYS